MPYLNYISLSPPPKSRPPLACFQILVEYQFVHVYNSVFKTA